MVTRLRFSLLVCVLGLAVPLGTRAQQPITVTSPDGLPIKVDAPASVNVPCVLPADSIFPLGVTEVPCPGTSYTVTVQGQRLLQQSDLVYDGAFLTPKHDGFNYVGQGLAVSDSGLFIGGKGNEVIPGTNTFAGQKIAEISIPTPVIATTLAALPVATFLQPFTEPTEGKWKHVQVNGGGKIFIGDMIVDGDRLCLTLFFYYDAGTSTQTLTLVCRPKDLSVTGQVQGPMAVVSNPAAVDVGNVTKYVASGYLSKIPTIHQAALGCSTAIGATPDNISGKASNGDDLFATCLDTLVDPQPIVPSFYFPQIHSPWPWSAQTTVWNGTTGSSTSCEIPDGFGSVSCFKRLGLGAFCYGPGTSDPTKDGTVVSGGRLCYDPTSTSKGDHAYPYAIWVNNYRIADLVAARAGTIKPWDVRPYASFRLDVPFSTIVAPNDPLRNGLSGSMAVYGVAYKSETRQLFITSGGNGTMPIIHVFHPKG